MATCAEDTRFAPDSAAVGCGGQDGVALDWGGGQAGGASGGGHTGLVGPVAGLMEATTGGAVGGGRSSVGSTSGARWSLAPTAGLHTRSSISEDESTDAVVAVIPHSSHSIHGMGLVSPWVP